MREWQRKRRAAALKASVIELLRAGVPPERIGKPETLRQRIRKLLLDRDALKARIEWQSGGIKTLRDELATLQARYATLEASLVSERVQAARLTALEVAQAVHEAEAALQVAHGTPRVYADYLEEEGEEP